MQATREGVCLSRRGAFAAAAAVRAGSARGQQRQQALRSRGGRRCSHGQRVGAAAASASLAVSSVGDALGRSGRPRARRALLSRRRPGGGLGRCRALEAGHDAHARELLAQGAHWLGEEVGDGVRQAWCPRADVEGQANVLRDDAPFQDGGRRVPDAVPVLKKLAHSDGGRDGGRGLLPLSSERFDEVAAGAAHRAASATLRPVVPDVDARQELGVAAGALLASRSKVLQLNMLLEGSKLRMCVRSIFGVYTPTSIYWYILLIGLPAYSGIYHSMGSIY